jgi:hypothetical protein
MSERREPRRVVGIGLALVGFVVLLGTAGYFGWQDYESRQLEAQLREFPTATRTVSVSVPAETAGLATVTAAAPGRVALTATTSPSRTPSSATAALLGVTPSQTASLAPTAVQSPVLTQSVVGAQSGPPVRIVIPDLGIDVDVIEMGWQAVETADGIQSQWVIPESAAGHHINSASLGESGNVVISGHNNVYGRVFEPISQAWDNDTLIRVDAVTDRSDVLNGRTIQLFDSAGERFDYAIEEFVRLRDTGVSLQQRIANAHFMQPSQDMRLTLVTCWPPWSNTHRLVVVAKPVGQR